MNNHLVGKAPHPRLSINHLLPHKAHSLISINNAAAVILNLNLVSRITRRGEEIVRAGHRSDSIFLIREGMAIRYRILRDGQRQILNFLLPGDFAGITGCRFAKAPYSTKFLTNGVVVPVPMPKLVSLFDTHPRLAAELLWSFGCDSVLGERLITVGRRTAKERVAHLLLELFRRLQRVSLADDRSFRLPLTQEMISDALGLSVPYVNRVLRELRDDGLVRIRGRLVVIDNLEQLSALADFETGYLQPLSIAEVVQQAE